MKLIIAGSRTIIDYFLVKSIVGGIIDPSDVDEVVSGKAAGVDTFGERWAEENHIPVKSFPADWNAHGKSAGPRRNAQMAAYADRAIVIMRGHSPGSLNMIDQMKRVHKPVNIYNIDHPLPNPMDSPEWN